MLLDKYFWSQRLTYLGCGFDFFCFHGGCVNENVCVSWILVHADLSYLAYPHHLDLFFLMALCPCPCLSFLYLFRQLSVYLYRRVLFAAELLFQDPLPVTSSKSVTHEC